MKNLLLKFFKMYEQLTKNFGFVPFGVPFYSLPRPILLRYIIP